MSKGSDSVTRRHHRTELEVECSIGISLRDRGGMESDAVENRRGDL